MAVRVGLKWATAFVDGAEHVARLYGELGALQADDMGASETPDRVI